MTEAFDRMIRALQTQVGVDVGPLSFCRFPAHVNPDGIDEWAAFCHRCDESAFRPIDIPEDELRRFVLTWCRAHDHEAAS